MNDCKPLIANWLKRLPAQEDLCANTIYFIKSGTNIKMYVTNYQGVPSQIGEIIDTNIIITSPDGSITITQEGQNFEISISQTLQAIINLSLQEGDNISLLNNDAGYLTTVPQDIPEDMFISTTVEGDYITYLIGGEYKQLDLQQFTSIEIFNSNEIVKNGNDLFITGNFSELDADLQYIIALYGCKITNGILTVSSWNSRMLPNSTIHGLIFHRDFLYLVNRKPLTTLLKINPYDLSDLRSLTMPDTIDTKGTTTDILGYKDKLYIVTNESTNTNVIEINENLVDYKLLFKIPNTTGYLTGVGAQPFLIYNDEMYIAFRYTSGVSSVRVFDLNGNAKRQTLLPNATGTGSRVLHWMGIFNDKLLITSVYRKALTRLDCKTLAVEEQILLDISVTDDNSISRDGYIYLNGEYNQFDTTNPPSKLYKVKYNDFTNITTEITVYNNNKGSYGSINPNLFKESLKTKLSDFGNDLVPVPTNLSYTPSAVQGTVNSDTGTDAIIPLVTTTVAGLASPEMKNAVDDYLSKNFIPLSGTETGEPITGSLKFDGYVGNGISYESPTDSNYTSSLFMEDGNFRFQNVNSTTGYQSYIGWGDYTDKIDVSGTDPEFKGLVGGAVYDKQDDLLAYPQLDDVVLRKGTLPTKPITGDLEMNGGYTENSIYKVNEGEDYIGDVFFGEDFIRLSANSSDFSQSTKLDVSKNLVYINSNPDSKGIVGNVLFDKQDDPNAFAQLGDITDSVGNSNIASDVDYPADITFRPFKITEQNGIFTTDFGVDDIVKDKISKMKAYYCNYETGSNSNDGLTPATAVKTVTYAYVTLGARLLYLTGGVHKSDSWGLINSGYTNTDDFFVLNYGDKETFITNAPSTNPTYTLESGTTYQYTLASTVNVVDMKYKDKKGFPYRMSLQTSIALVNANPGSFFVNGSTVYINTLDGRVPDTNIISLRGGINTATYNANAGYHFVKGITFMGGSLENGTHGVNSQVSSNSTLVSLAKNCKYLYGQDTSYNSNGGEGTRNLYNKINLSEDCIAYGNSRDGFNYLADSVGANKMFNIEINCQGFQNGERQTSASVNGSSGHGPCEVIRINGKYYKNSGPNVIDVDGAIAVNYGTIAFNSIAATPQDNIDFCTNTTNGIVSKQYNYKCKSYNSTIAFRIGGTQEAYIINKDVFYKGTYLVGNALAPQTITFGDFPTSNVVSPALPLLSSFVEAPLKANDADVVKLTGSQTIAGVKTFSSSPIVPTPTTGTQVTNKDYVDNSNIISSAATLSITPGVPNSFYTFNGTNTTWTLGSLASLSGKYIAIMNMGSGTITLNSNSGGNDILESATSMNTTAIASFSTYTLFCNGIKFVAL